MLGSWATKVGWKFSAWGMWLTIQCHQLYPSTPCPKPLIYPRLGINLQTFHEMGKEQSPRDEKWQKRTPSKKCFFQSFQFFTFLPVHTQFHSFFCWQFLNLLKIAQCNFGWSSDFFTLSYSFIPPARFVMTHLPAFQLPMFVIIVVSPVFLSL